MKRPYAAISGRNRPSTKGLVYPTLKRQVDQRQIAVGKRSRAVAIAPIGSSRTRLQAELAHLAIECRAPDAEPLGHLSHVPAVAPQRQTDHVRFHRLERADLALVGNGG